jgi:hypothetical protein
MAVAVYTTDLVSIIQNIASTTGWTALGGGASGLGIGPDMAMQGTNAIDKPVTASEKGMVYDNGAAITPAANTHFFVWVFLATPGLSATLANRGLAAILGTSATVYTAFHLEGNDTYGAAGRVARCYPVRYVTGTVAGVKTNTGAPGANPQFFGSTANIAGTVKGSNLGISAIRYGTGLFITAGEVALPATFAGTAAVNDAIANRWGILTQLGASFELQGRMVVGQTSAGTPTAAYFAASNQTVSMVDTPHSLTDFTQLIVDHASTVFNLTNITFKAVGTNNRGRLVYNNASTVSALTGVTFDGMGISTLRAGVTATNCTWRASGQVTPNAATITNSLFEASSDTTGALVFNSTASASAASGCQFKNNAKAIRITAAGTYTFAGHQFSGNTVEVDFTGTGTCTINPAAGCNVAAVRCVATGGGTIVVNAISTIITLSGFPVGTDVVVLTAGTSTILYQLDAHTSTSVSVPYTGNPTVDIGFIKEGYQVFYVRGLTLPSTDSTLPVKLQLDRNFT